MPPKILKSAAEIVKDAIKAVEAEKKASEALGKVEGKTLMVTESDRTKVGQGYLGGPGFSSLQLTDPAYRDVGAVWGVAAPGKATTILNASRRVPEGQHVFTTMVGSPTQHRSNQQVFNKLLDEFRASAREGNLSEELQGRINDSLRSAINKEGNPIFAPNVDIMSPKFRKQANTFERRAVAADLIAGEGLGGKKGQIIDFEKVMRRTTDPMLLDVKTGSMGPRLFTLSGETIQRPDLHPAFPSILTGEDLGVSFKPVPIELMFRDYVRNLMETKGRKPGYMDITRGHGPKQFISEDLLTEMQKAGYAKGGSIDLEAEYRMGKGGLLKKAVKAVREAIQPTAPQDEALRIAQKNAAKPVSEGGLGLPKNNTPMDRARAMGFEGDFYHGTNAENVIGEMRLGGGKLGDAAYVTNNPMNAKNYPILHNMARKNKGLEPLPPSIYPVMVRRGNTLNLDSLPVGQVDSKKIADAGYDSISHRHETAVIDPSRIRSRFAAFDPARIDENDLLAGFAALGITAPMLTSEEPEYRNGGAVMMKRGGKAKGGSIDLEAEYRSGGAVMMAGGGEAQAAPYGLRETGMPKGKGYFGKLPTADGVMTELSASDDAGDFPLIVPTLTAAELKHLQSGGEPTAEIYAKAKAWAESRKGQGRDPFATSEDLRMPVPEYAKGGAIKSLVKAIAKELPEAKASQKTQIPGTEPTYRKAYDILEREMPGGRTLDYGAGLGHGSRLMGAESFEPFPREGFKPDFIRPEDIPTEEFDRLVNLNVLNVIPREMRDATVENIGRVMRPGGMGIVTTRGRDVLNAAGEAGPEPMSKITSIGTYQKGFLPEELRQYLEYILGRDYSVSKLGLGPAGAVVRKKGKAEGGEIKRADGGAIGKNVGRGMAGLTRSRQPLDPKEIQAMMLDVPAGLGVPFAEAGAEYLRGNIEDAKTSAAIDAALTAVPVAGALAKPAYRAVKKGVQKAAPAARDLAREFLESGMESGAIIDPRMQAIAYHGTPHKFEKFDPSKIGTGEGAQAYGHGLYFAESPEIATGYRNRLAKGTIPVVDALPAEAGKNIPESAYSFIRGYEDVDAAIQGLRETTQNVPDFIKKAWSHNPKGLEKLHKDYLKSADWLEKNKDRIQIIQDRGHLYTVDIPDESVARMLDWDKPLEQQPAIRGLLKGTDYEVGLSAKEAEKIADERLRQEAYDWADETGGDPVDYMNNANWEKYVDDVMQESGKVHGSTTGKELHKIIMRDQGYRKELFDPYNYQVDTSETLRGLGIPGIKYLDATSRSAGEGTRNFVVFPGEEETVKILERKKRGGAVIMKSGGKIKSAADMFHAKGHQALMDFDNKIKKRKG